ILELVKAPIPGNLHGRSLRPILDGSGRLAEHPVYAEALYGNLHFGWSPLAAMTTSRLQYIRAPREELFDLGRDPRERENSVDDRVKERQALSAALDRLAPRGRTRQPGLPETLADPKDTYDIVETYR